MTTGKQDGKTKNPAVDSNPPDAETRRIDLAEISAQIETQLTDTDERRAAGLGAIAGLRAAKAHVLEREARLLEARAGRETPATTAIDETVAHNQTLAKELGVEAARARHPPPQVMIGELAVHGTVDDAGIPVAGARVALRDATSTSGADLAVVTTGTDGYFVMRIEEPAGGAGARTRSQGRNLQVRVLDATGGTRHVQLLDVSPRLDGLTFVGIHIPTVAT